MFQSPTGLLSSLFSKSRGNKRISRRAKAAQRGLGRPPALEELEARLLLVSRVFLDFGEGFATETQNVTSPYLLLQVMEGLQPAELRNALVGAGVSGRNKLEERFGILSPGVLPTIPPIDFTSFASTINTSVNPTPVPVDALTLELAITAQIQQALEPFDIQVISSAESNFFGFPVRNIATTSHTSLTNASSLMALNNLPGDGGSPVNGTATVPQSGSDDVYIYLVGVFQNVTVGEVQVARPGLVPISAVFAASAGPSQGAQPDRLDTGAIIDVNYWVNRVLGDGGTGGDLNVAIANAALYAIGFCYGVSETENGVNGPGTQFFDPNVGLINQSNVMQEAGFADGLINAPFTTPINDTRAAYFQRFPMMQNGVDTHLFLRPGTINEPALLQGTPFPLPSPPSQNPFFFSVVLSQVGGTVFYFVPPDSTINSDPTLTVNSYDQLANDPDIGPNPGVAYVTGTGAFDQITITKLNATQARVTINAFTDNTYTTLATADVDGDGISDIVASFSYIINLTKVVIPGRKDDGVPFRIVVQGCSSDDQIYIDSTLGVNVIVHGGPDVKFVQFTGDGAYNVQYTPASPPTFFTPNLQTKGLIYEGLLPSAAGTMKITGTTTTRTGKTVTVNPFTTTIAFDHLNPANSSAVRVDNFNKLTYSSPGFLNNQFTVTNLNSGLWNIGGQIISPFYSPAQTGALQMTNVKQLAINTTLGASNDTITFVTGGVLPTGLQSVSVATGTGIDSLIFDDSSVFTNLNYALTPTLVQYIPVVGTLFSGFFGFTYSGVESLSLTGTTGINTFVVTPSKTTTYFVDGSADTDTLAVRLNGTTGAVNTPGAPGSGAITFTSGHKTITYANIESFDPPPNAATPPNIVLAVGAGPGTNGKPLVKVYNATTHAFIFQFLAYPVSFKGGVQVAVADVNGDGRPDIITAPGPGNVIGDTGDQVKVWLSNATVTAWALAGGFYPEAATYKSGLYIAVGNVDGVGLPEIITSAARILKPVVLQPTVRVFDSTTFLQVGPTIFPYSSAFVSGAVVAAADVDGDGRADIITAPGVGQTATVKIFDGQFGTFIRQFNAYPASFKGGVSIAAGDVDADGKAEIIIGGGTGGGSLVKVFDASQGILLNQFQAYTTSTTAPVRVAVHDVVYGGNDDTGKHAVTIYTGQGVPGATHDIRAFEPLSSVQVDHFLETAIDMKGGVFVG